MLKNIFLLLSFDWDSAWSDSTPSSRGTDGRIAPRTRKRTWIVSRSDESLDQVPLPSFSETAGARGETPTLRAGEKIVALLLQHHWRHWPGTAKRVQARGDRSGSAICRWGDRTRGTHCARNEVALILMELLLGVGRLTLVGLVGLGGAC